ncbi:MAG: SUF system NifU family Fe-S cluster assembly protein [Gammaproteobacteria bacterium]|nr:SUF system NifU family Fe-S cluster assembly protein [Gammaproteobacteria bacterium]
MTKELMQVYQKTVLEHSRKPHHFGKLVNATHSAEGFNPLCGDKVTVHLTMNSNGTINEVSHETTGCAICMSSASMMADAIQALDSAAANALCSQVHTMLTSDSNDNPPGMPLKSLEGVRAYPSRVKCATLPWQTLLTAMMGETLTTTE